MDKSEKSHAGLGVGTLQRLATILGWAAPLLCCLMGIWFGIGNEYGDWTPNFDRVLFAMIIAGIPFILPFGMNLVSIPFLYRDQYRRTGLLLFASSCIMALAIGIVAVRIGNF